MRSKIPSTAITEKKLKQLIREAGDDAGSISEWAKDEGITPQAVSAFMRNTQSAGLQIPQALGYKPQVIFIPLKEDDICHSNPSRPKKKSKR